MLNTKQFFLDYAQALLSFSAEKIAAFYQVPLTVYADEGIQQVDKMDDVIAFWEQGVKPYKERGITNSVPEILSEEQLSKTIFISKVHWTSTNAAGEITGDETNFYILSKSDDGFKISGLIIITDA